MNNICMHIIILNTSSQWKTIRHKQNARWQHLSQLKQSSYEEMQQLMLGIGNATYWVIEPYFMKTPGT
jgi:hypothetical protein